MLSSVSDVPTSPLLSPTALPAGPADGFLQMCSAPIGPASQFHRRSPSPFQISSLMQMLQRIVGGEGGVSTRQSAGERRVSELRWDGVFCAVTPPREKHKIASDLPASSWRRITRSIWPEANAKNMAARRDPPEYKCSVLECPVGPVSIIVSKPSKM